MRDALRADVGRHRLDAADLERPFHGVRAPVGSTSGLFERCLALATRFRVGDAFAGSTAAALWGMPSALGDQHRMLHVSSPAPLHPMRRRGVVGTLRAHEDIAVVSGLPLSAPASAWVEFAAEGARIPDLVAAADWAVTPRRDRAALLELDSFVAGVLANERRHGVADARRALALVRTGAWSPSESHVRILLAQHGLPEPELNLAVGDEFVVDLAWPAYRVAVEYNGAHHDRPEHRIRDLSRAEALVELGWSIVNVDRVGLYGAPGTVVSRVAQRLRSRGWRGSIRWPKTASLWYPH